MKKFLKTLQYSLRQMYYLKAVLGLTPFKAFLPKIHVGGVMIGTPYFLPRVWKKYTLGRAGYEAYSKVSNMNLPPEKRHEAYNSEVARLMKYSYAVPKKIGFDFVPLGWKTKWTDTDIRHEWDPIWSFVFFKWQIALIFTPKNNMQYWESFLYYTRHTKGSKKERVLQAYISSKEGIESQVDYYNHILKNKYL